jgi:predicted phosphodiesterase
MTRPYTWFLPVAGILTLCAFIGCSPRAQFREEIGPAGNEYIDPVDPSEDDSDQMLTDYTQLPDSVRSLIERILPAEGQFSINHWGPFRYTVTKRFTAGHANKVFVYLTGDILQILYIDGRYQERPGRFFVSGTWQADSDIGPTYVVEVVGFQDGDTTAFAYRPDGVLRTMSEYRRMRTGLQRKWSPQEIENLLGKYRTKYSVDSVLKRIKAVPFDPDSGFRFIVLGDNRVDRSVWEAVCKSASNKSAAFVFDTGDLVNTGSPEEFDEYLFATLDEYGHFNFLPVVGNHDIDDDGLALGYLASFGTNSLNYYFDYGGARFVILDNCSRATDFLAQLDIADKWLAETPEDYYKFVFVHVPPGEIRKWSYHSMSGEKSRRFTDLMSAHEVDHVFTGHIHA